jgi:signal transduction histidine kinase
MDAGIEARTTPSADGLEVLVALLLDLDADRKPGSRPFYDGICEAACRLTSMRRALLLLWDSERALVVPEGSHGVPPDLVALFYGSLDETPIAQRAITEDRVIDVHDVHGLVPERYADVPAVTSIACAPVAAGDRPLGVIFADRNGDAFELTDAERQTLWMLGKLAAVAASARTVTAQQERSRSLAEGVRLAREVHEQVMQRLFGVSMVLGSAEELTAAERRRCASELEAALSELRDALSRPLAPAGPPGATLRGELDRLGDHYKDIPLSVTWAGGAELPPEFEPLAASALAEALRNAEKHATPSLIEVAVGEADGAFSLEVRNDGVAAASRQDGGDGMHGSGMGLHLATLELMQHGGVVEYGPEGEDGWRTRVLLPTGGGAA